MMESKKNPNSDINKKTGLFFNIGLLISLTLIIVAFEWRSYEHGSMVNISQINDNFDDLLEIPPTQQPPPPSPKIQQPEIIEIPDEEEIEEDIEIDLDVEITEDDIIEELILEEAPAEETVDEIFQIVEEPATPVGGYSKFYKYVGEHMNYPNQAKRMGIEGRVFVQFVVGPDGSINEVQAVRGIGAGCDEEAVRILKNAPSWNPPKQRGRPVSQRIMIQIVFQLN